MPATVQTAMRAPVESSAAARLSVLHLSAADNAGGSGRSAYRLHSGLKQLGVASRMLVGRRVTDDPDVALITDGWRGRLEQFGGRIADRLGLQYWWYPSSGALAARPWFREADVVQVFNTHGGYFSHLALARLSRLRPIVWRLSDMWAMTGHCAYSYECGRWQTGCGRCPHLAEYPRLSWDTSALLWRMKRRVYAESRMTIVAPSRWLEGLARRSPLLNRFPIARIPNGLDTAVFRPRPKGEARKRFGLSGDGPVVMFSASSVQVERKGGRLLEQALGRLAQAVSGVRLLVVGDGADSWQAFSPMAMTAAGYLDRDEDLAAAYSAADLFVLPTLADNLPNGILESMACGTPAVSFDVGGVSDAVRHLETGYLARPQDAGDLAEGMRCLLEDAQLRTRLGRRGREVAEAEYTLERQAGEFLKLYRQVAGTRERQDAGLAR
jgi:glycosyltransferase involved in cell wall biosynthesis